jgi:site-specific DNA-methyltransferase (adenine-specific)
MTLRVEHGHCIDVMRALADEGVRVDSVVCDPPYHLTSIVKRFGAENAAPAQHGKDGAFARASRGFMGKAWDGGDIAFRAETWRACYELMKPGAYIVAFGSSRGYGRMQVAMEEAGFLTHPLLGWIFACGFPKATRLKAPDTDHLRYGMQALKPALEPIYMGQKPMEGTGTQNWMEHGTGALNIDGCRIATDETIRTVQTPSQHAGTIYGADQRTRNVFEGHAAGRWPANVLHDGSEEVLDAFAMYGESKSQGGRIGKKSDSVVGIVPAGEYRKGDPGFGDFGTAARFFFSAKADADDRIGSKHPTVKPVQLMRWLVRLVTPKGGVVLDPFAGTGTTGVAAIREGMDAILIEREAEYVADIQRRLAMLSGLDTPLLAGAAR